LKNFKNILEKNIFYTKVGFSLLIDDLLDTNPNKKKVIAWESKYWNVKTKDGDFIADIDTTFALYKPLKFWNPSLFYKAIRLNKPFLARHGGWYIDIENPTEEELFYTKTANSSSSWLSDKSFLKDKYYSF
jgi:hypothetical protein